METEAILRKLVAIVSLDVAGYSRLMAADEMDTLLEIDPDFGPDYLARYTFTDEQREMIVSSLRTAGLRV